MNDPVRQPSAHAVVTGGAGFLGRHLCRSLARDGIRVTAVDNLCTAAPDAPDDLAVTGTRLVRADVADPRWYRNIGDTPPDIIFHLACPASPRDYRRLAIDTLEACAVGTRNVLECARSCGPRVVIASTSEVYGDPVEHPQHEQYRGNVDPVGPRSVYDEGKRYAEALARAYRDRHGADVSIARIFNTYGPGMRPDDGRMIPTFLSQALAGEPLTVAGTGEQTRSLCYVDDLVDGLRALADLGCFGPVNLGNPEEITVAEVAAHVCACTGHPGRTVHVAAAEDDPQRRCPDISKARRLLGWSPRVTLDDGLLRTVRAWPETPVRHSETSANASDKSRGAPAFGPSPSG
ncbi:NAD-dependent epimerase/dehydratase family protein [Tomitella gaofuii]|uniref:NAD-dependent epimerase/dehydratase family protein n=1 Tax=Tomitella gaofuii TaxID=2760083 RepID=UPI0015FE4796|nr:NAD-dependent epimerase/dehydratase family protein [Tomitella gaofuii]